MILAGEVRWQLALDEVRFVVAATPPHRGAPALPADFRAVLVERAIAEEESFTVSRVELERPGPSYTVETVEAFAAAEPATDFWLVLGADQLRDFPRWREPERILRSVRLAVAERGGVDRAALEQVAPGRVDWTRMPHIGVSSTLIRERLAAGEPVGHLLPAGVEELLAGESVLRIRGAQVR